MKSTLAIIIMLQCVILGTLAESSTGEIICAVAGIVWMIIAVVYTVIEVKDKS